LFLTTEELSQAGRPIIHKIEVKEVSMINKSNSSFKEKSGWVQAGVQSFLRVGFS
jgi:hypothetical protein